MKKKLRKFGAGRWPLQRDLLKLFGNPSAPGWTVKHIDDVKPPFKMFFGKIPVKRIQINKLVADDFKAILNEIWEASGKSQDKIHEWGMDAFSGSHVVRAIRGGTSYSNHSFGMAVDFDSARNALGNRHGNFTADHPVVKIFEKHGVRWGGRYKKRADPMHFEWVSG